MQQRGGKNESDTDWNFDGGIYAVESEALMDREKFIILWIMNNLMNSKFLDDIITRETAAGQALPSRPEVDGVLDQLKVGLYQRIDLNY